MQITLDKNDIKEAIKKYMENSFGMSAPGIELNNTKGVGITAAVTLDKMVTIGPGQVEIIAGKPEVDKTPFVQKEVEKKKIAPKKDKAVEPVIVEEDPGEEDLIEEGESKVVGPSDPGTLFAI